MHNKLISLLQAYPDALALIIVPYKGGWWWYKLQDIEWSPNVISGELTKEQFFAELTDAYYVGVVVPRTTNIMPKAICCHYPDYSWIYINA